MSSPLKLAVEELIPVIPQLPARDQDFANSLVQQWRAKGLSAKQAAWIERLISRAKSPAPTAIAVGSMQGIVTLLETAAQHLKHPSVLVRALDHDLRLSIAGKTAKVPGSINICSIDRGFDNRAWYGRVTRAGVFEPSPRFDGATLTAIGAALSAMASDPAAAAAAYGHLTGVCCFCGRSLSDDRSTEVGYGPVCAKNFGLEWGSKSKR